MFVKKVSCEGKGGNDRRKIVVSEIYRPQCQPVVSTQAHGTVHLTCGMDNVIYPTVQDVERERTEEISVLASMTKLGTRVDTLSSVVAAKVGESEPVRRPRISEQYRLVRFKRRRSRSWRR